MCKPLSSALDSLPDVVTRLGLLVKHQQQQQQPGNGAVAADQQLTGSYLPPADDQLSRTQEVQLVALGRCWAKAVLEGIHIPMELCGAVFRWDAGMGMQLAAGQHADQCAPI